MQPFAEMIESEEVTVFGTYEIAIAYIKDCVSVDFPNRLIRPLEILRDSCEAAPERIYVTEDSVFVEFWSD